MYPTAAGLKFLIQQKTSGTGKFLGAEFGRARCTLDPGLGDAAKVYVAARLYGTPANSLTVELVDYGLNVEVTETRVEQDGSAIRVILRRTVNGVQATADEVADAINRYVTFSPTSLAIKARAGGTDEVAAVAATALTAGLNPEVDDNKYLWTAPTNADAGFFHFEQEQPTWVLGFSALFDIAGQGPYTVKVSRVRIRPDFTIVAGESIPIFVHDFLSNDKPDIAYTDVKQLVHPGMAILVETNGGGFGGVVNLDVQKAAEYPYA